MRPGDASGNVSDDKLPFDKQLTYERFMMRTIIPLARHSNTPAHFLQKPKFVI